MVRFGRGRKDCLKADPILLKRYNDFNDKMCIIAKKFDELASEMGRAAMLLEEMGLNTDSTKIMYEKTKLWDVKNEILGISNGDALNILSQNIGLYNPNVTVKGAYRYG